MGLVLAHFVSDDPAGGHYCDADLDDWHAERLRPAISADARRAEQCDHIVLAHRLYAVDVVGLYRPGRGGNDDDVPAVDFAGDCLADQRAQTTTGLADEYRPIGPECSQIYAVLSAPGRGNCDLPVPVLLGPDHVA